MLGSIKSAPNPRHSQIFFERRTVRALVHDLGPHEEDDHGVSGYPLRGDRLGVHRITKNARLEVLGSRPASNSARTITSRCRNGAISSPAHAWVGAFADFGSGIANTLTLRCKSLQATPSRFSRRDWPQQARRMDRHSPQQPSHRIFATQAPRASRCPPWWHAV